MLTDSTFTGRIPVKQVLAFVQPATALTVKGWVRTVRRGKEVAFIELNDGSCFASLQIVLSPDLSHYDDVTRLGTGACVSVTGNLVESPAQGQMWELQATQVEVLGTADDTYPL